MAEKELEFREQQKPVDYILKGPWNDLLNLALNGLRQTGYTLESDQYGDDLDNTISIRCTILLQNLSQIVKDQVVDPCLDFVTNMLKEQDCWLKDYVILLVLSCIIEGPSKQKIEANYEGNIKAIFDYSTNQSPRVRAACGICIANLCQHCPKLFVG